MIYAIDFDGVIHDENPPPSKKMGKPIPGTREAMMDLADKGRVIIFTVRATTPQTTRAVADWLKFFGIPFTEITNVKPNADVFIDDRAIRFTTWSEVMDQL